VAEASQQAEGTCKCWLNLPALTLSPPLVSQIGQEGEPLPTGEHLTRRESEVLALLAQGLSNGQIAEKLVLSVVTVNSYLRSIYSKLGVSSRTGAVRYALDHRLV
jgi:DNA-binding NarL/FixJ family response regulator